MPSKNCLALKQEANGTDMKLVTYFKIKNAHLVIDEVQAVVTNWKKYAASYDVKNNSKNSIQKVIERLT